MRNLASVFLINLLVYLPAMAQHPPHWLGIHISQRGPALSYGRQISPAGRLMMVGHAGVFSDDFVPYQVFPRGEIQYRHLFLEDRPTMDAKARWGISPWLGMSRLRTRTVLPEFGYWASDAGMKVVLVANLFGSSNFEFEWSLGLGYRYLHLQAPSWFVLDENYPDTFWEKFQAPYQGWYPRFGMAVFLGS